jgi:hypothetical protein
MACRRSTDHSRIDPLALTRMSSSTEAAVVVLLLLPDQTDRKRSTASLASAMRARKAALVGGGTDGKGEGATSPLAEVG